MTEVNTLFINAAFKKYRYTGTTFNGAISTEDVCALPLRDKNQTLNDIARVISKQIAEQGELNFIDDKSTISKELEEKLEIVKYIISIKKQEETAKEAIKEVRQKARELDELIHEGEMAEMKALPLEELKKRRASLPLV
jgi:vacuolar-type H+-ATPase catalytic subunit A/Vma1